MKEIREQPTMIREERGPLFLRLCFVFANERSIVIEGRLDERKAIISARNGAGTLDPGGDFFTSTNREVVEQFDNFVGEQYLLYADNGAGHLYRRVRPGEKQERPSVYRIHIEGEEVHAEERTSKGWRTARTGLVPDLHDMIQRYKALARADRAELILDT